MQTFFNKDETSEWKSRFRNDGYLLLPGFLGREEVGAVLRELEALITERVPSMPPEAAFYEDPSDPATLKQIQLLYEHSDHFRSMMFGSRFQALASILMDDDAVGRNMQYFNKPPGVGKPTPPHQDGYYFMLEPNEAVTMWLGLDAVDEENGCVRYVRGSHLEGIRPHGRSGVLGFSQGITDFGKAGDLDREVWSRTAPGDLLVHHSLTIHRADGNRTADRPRRALGFIYYAAAAREDVSRKQAYQETLAREIRDGAGGVA
jgi:phytanoyl-CoA hydroxylase